LAKSQEQNGGGKNHPRTKGGPTQKTKEIEEQQ